MSPKAGITRSFRAAGIGSRFLAEGLGYGAAEVAAVSPTEATLLELGLQLIDDAPELQSALNAGLAARQDENAFVERIKNAPRRFLEGGPVGMLFERALTALGIAYKVIRNSPAYKKQTLPGQPRPACDPGRGHIQQVVGDGAMRPGRKMILMSVRMSMRQPSALWGRWFAGRAGQYRPGNGEKRV